MKFDNLLLSCFLGGTLFLSSLNAANWPNYMGPDKNSISPDTTPLADSWPEDGPPVVWSREISSGHGGSAIFDGEVYVLDRVDSEKDVLMVLDLKTGNLLRSGEIESEGRVNFPGSRTVPTVTDEYVFTGGPMGIYAAWRRDDLKLLWTFDLIKQLDAKPMHFGYNVHPQVHGDLVILAAHSEQASLFALRANTGKLVWKVNGLGGSLSSPVIRNFQGRDQVLYISNEKPEGPRSNGKPSVVGVDPVTGKLLWQYNGYQENVPIPPPTVVDDNHLLLTGGYEAGAQLLKFGKADEPNIQLVKSFKWGSQICPPIVFDGHIYYLSQENATLKRRTLWSEVGLTCITVDGVEKWVHGSEPMFGRGAMILADGKLIIRDSYHGLLYLVQPSPNGYQQHAVANPFNLDNRNLKRWAPLAISGGMLIIRDERELKCLDLRR